MGGIKGVPVYFWGGHVFPVFPGPVGCQQRVEHGVIDGILGRILSPCLYTCPFSSCKPSFIQHSARHCSLDQCRHPDRLMESNTYTDRLMHPPNTGGLASSNRSFCPTFHSFTSQSIQLSLNPLDVRFSLGLVPVFALKPHKAPKAPLKSCPCLSAQALICCYAALFPVVSIFSAWPHI